MLGDICLPFAGGLPVRGKQAWMNYTYICVLYTSPKIYHQNVYTPYRREGVHDLLYCFASIFMRSMYIHTRGECINAVQLSFTQPTCAHYTHNIVRSTWGDIWRYLHRNNKWISMVQPLYCEQIHYLITASHSACVCAMAGALISKVVNQLGRTNARVVGGGAITTHCTLLFAHCQCTWERFPLLFFFLPVESWYYRIAAVRGMGYIDYKRNKYRADWQERNEAGKFHFCRWAECKSITLVAYNRKKRMWRERERTSGDLMFDER